MHSSKSILIPTAYLPALDYMSAFLKADNILIEKQEHYPKQTYRNRCYIYSPNGKLMLTIPVKRGNPEHTPVKEVQISYLESWQKIHWRSLESAYRSSPYFEFYEDHFRPFYEKNFNFLVDFNEQMLERILKSLKVEKSYAYTESYEKQKEGFYDMRDQFNSKIENTVFQFERYPQVFENKFGFISNLSIIDLLCNEGPNAANLLIQE